MVEAVAGGSFKTFASSVCSKSVASSELAIWVRSKSASARWSEFRSEGAGEGHVSAPAEDRLFGKPVIAVGTTGRTRERSDAVQAMMNNS